MDYTINDARDDTNNINNLNDYIFGDLLIKLNTIIMKSYLVIMEYFILLVQWTFAGLSFFSIMLNNAVLCGSGFILNWTTTIFKNNPRRRIILDRESNEDYLERYYLLLKSRGSFPFNIFIHKFCKSDPGDLHDHPWNFAHIILYGGYWETVTVEGDPRETVRLWRGPGYFNYVTADYMHKIELDEDQPKPVTLFIPFKRDHEWGFYKIKENNDVEYVDHNTYFASKKQT